MEQELSLPQEIFIRFISHRGNYVGKNDVMENHPDRVRELIIKGYDVEVDIWLIENQFYLGHDRPTHEVNIDFLRLHKDKLWLHCKNGEALNCLGHYSREGKPLFNYFWHQKDDYTLTSKGYIWTYPGVELQFNSVVVLPETIEGFELGDNCLGICSDEIEKYRDEYCKIR